MLRERVECPAKERKRKQRVCEKVKRDRYRERGGGGWTGRERGERRGREAGGGAGGRGERYWKLCAVVGWNKRFFGTSPPASVSGVG